MTDDEAQLPSSDPGSSRGAPQDSAAADPRAAQSPQRLQYAPPLPHRSAEPIPLDYSRPATGPSKELHPVIAFIGGMIAAVVVPTVCIMPLGRSEGPLVVVLILMVLVPVVMLAFRSTRFFGAGWLSAYALGLFALFMICGMK